MGIICKKGPLLFFLLLAGSHLFGQANKISWTGVNKLAWEDFQGKPDAASEHTATTVYWLDYTYKWDGNGKLTMKVNCSFLRDKSWKKTDKKLTPELLDHEQLHFDIAEIHARKMRQAFSNFAFAHTNNSNTKADLENIFRKTMDEVHAMNAKYDEETNHSKNIASQRQWSLKIKSMLQELSGYAEPI